VIERLPCTISLTRRGGTLMSRARRYWESPISWRKSSNRTSPGWIGVSLSEARAAVAMFSFSVIIDDLDVVRIAVEPAEADPPLVIHPDAVLPTAIAFQSLQMVAGGNFQIVEPLGSVHLNELAQHHTMEFGREAAAGCASEQPPRLTVSETLDHTASITTCVITGKTCSCAETSSSLTTKFRRVRLNNPCLRSDAWPHVACNALFGGGDRALLNGT